MAYNTFRTKDIETERELAKFLDKYLYTKDIFTRAERTDNALTQIEGSDIILTIPRPTAFISRRNLRRNM